MAKHEDMLEEGPRQAPEPETAEERSKKLGLKTAGGAVAGGGLVAAKAGILGKIVLWAILWNGASNAIRIGGWIGILLLVAIIGAWVTLHRRGRV